MKFPSEFFLKCSFHRAREIAAMFQANGRKAVIINNETLGIDRNSTYKTSQVAPMQYRLLSIQISANSSRACPLIKETCGCTIQAEKNARASLKAAVERELNKEAVLIADDLNYIKGYRYELFCIARAMGARKPLDALKILV